MSLLGKPSAYGFHNSNFFPNTTPIPAARHTARGVQFGMLRYYDSGLFTCSDLSLLLIIPIKLTKMRNTNDTNDRYYSKYWVDQTMTFIFLSL